MARRVLNRVVPMYGIDLIPTAVDWPKVASSGRTFAYLRAAYGLMPDQGFASAWRAMGDAGIQRGAWQVIRHDLPVVDQAVRFVNLVELERGDLPPMLDLERLATCSPATVIETVRTWISVVESELEARHGCLLRPIIRTSTRAWPVRNGQGGLNNYGLWIVDFAQFDKPPLPKTWEGDDWTFHHYATGTLGVPGTLGAVQLDRFNPIKLGDRGRRVWHVKDMLRKAGFGFGVSETSELDAQTQRAVVQFQNQRGLVEDGIVDPRTFAELHWP